MDGGARSDIVTATVIVTDVTLDKCQLFSNLLRHRATRVLLARFAYITQSEPIHESTVIAAIRVPHPTHYTY